MQRTVTSTKIQRLFQYGDRPWNTGVIAAALLVPALMLAIGWMLWRDSTTARATYGMKFLVPTLDASWNPVAEEFQAWPFIYGTLLTSMTALLLSLPVSLGVAVFLAELCPNWLYQPLSWMIELLAESGQNPLFRFEGRNFDCRTIARRLPDDGNDRLFEMWCRRNRWQMNAFYIWPYRRRIVEHSAKSGATAQIERREPRIRALRR